MTVINGKLESTQDFPGSHQVFHPDHMYRRIRVTPIFLLALLVHQNIADSPGCGSQFLIRTEIVSGYVYQLQSTVRGSFLFNVANDPVGQADSTVGLGIDQEVEIEQGFPGRGYIVFVGIGNALHIGIRPNTLAVLHGADGIAHKPSALLKGIQFVLIVLSRNQLQGYRTVGVLGQGIGQIRNVQIFRGMDHIGTIETAGIEHAGGDPFFLADRQNCGGIGLGNQIGKALEIIVGSQEADGIAFAAQVITQSVGHLVQRIVHRIPVIAHLPQDHVLVNLRLIGLVGNRLAVPQDLHRNTVGFRPAVQTGEDLGEQDLVDPASPVHVLVQQFKIRHSQYFCHRHTNISSICHGSNLYHSYHLLVEWVTSEGLMAFRGFDGSLKEREREGKQLIVFAKLLRNLGKPVTVFI